MIFKNDRKTTYTRSLQEANNHHTTIFRQQLDILLSVVTTDIIQNHINTSTSNTQHPNLPLLGFLLNNIEEAFLGVVNNHISAELLTGFHLLGTFGSGVDLIAKSLRQLQEINNPWQ